MVATRSGLSLLEVLVALTIFLVALIGIGRIITISGERSLDVHQQGEAAQLCQAKLAEVIAGVVPLSSQGETTIEEAPDWLWSLECDSENVPGVWNVRVRVYRTRVDGSRVECALSQLVLDPAQRGNLSATTSAASGATTGASTDSTSSSGTGAASSTPAATGPSNSGAAPSGGPPGGSSGGQPKGGGGGQSKGRN